MRLSYAIQGYAKRPIAEDKLMHQSFHQGVSGSTFQE